MLEALNSTMHIMFHDPLWAKDDSAPNAGESLQRDRVGARLVMSLSSKLLIISYVFYTFPLQRNGAKQRSKISN